MKPLRPLLFTAIILLTPCLWAPAPALAQGKTAAAGVDMQKARALVLELPEVKAWQDKRADEAAKRQAGSPPAGGILTGLRQVQGVKHWAVTLYEDPQTSARKFAVFLVRARDGRIFVESDAGKPETLEQWRSRRPAV